MKIEFIGAVDSEDLKTFSPEVFNAINSYALVRCRDCKHYNKQFKECNLSMVDISPDDFCSKGEIN